MECLYQCLESTGEDINFDEAKEQYDLLYPNGQLERPQYIRCNYFRHEQCPTCASLNDGSLNTEIRSEVQRIHRDALNFTIHGNHTEPPSVSRDSAVVLMKNLMHFPFLHKSLEITLFEYIFKHNLVEEFISSTVLDLDRISISQYPYDEDLYFPWGMTQLLPFLLYMPLPKYASSAITALKWFVSNTSSLYHLFMNIDSVEAIKEMVREAKHKCYFNFEGRIKFYGRVIKEYINENPRFGYMFLEMLFNDTHPIAINLYKFFQSEGIIQKIISLDFPRKFDAIEDCLVLCDIPGVREGHEEEVDMARIQMLCSLIIEGFRCSEDSEVYTQISEILVDAGFSLAERDYYQALLTGNFIRLETLCCMNILRSKTKLEDLSLPHALKEYIKRGENYVQQEIFHPLENS